ncbi:MAG: DHA2 family efflux MFS transporter permease subunit [Marmoricola sp.]
MAQTQTQPQTVTPPDEIRPWPALFTLVIGFFMILVDLTIVMVATPTISEKLHAGVNSVIWVSSAYMLAYAVPILITGRLGDRFGSKRLYMIGLALFTAASLWCGLTTSIEWLIIARTVQGFGAAIMTPQTMAIITRIFPPMDRGKAMAVWGATAGVAMVVGPILGGVLTDAFGWEWIFIINVPVGLVGLLMAQRRVPVLSTNPHKFDWIGVALSGVGLFLLAYGIQQGHQESWAGWIIAMIVGGLALLGLFVVWQALNKQEPLVPLFLFKDRNFSVSTIAITVMGSVAASFGFPLMLYAQAVRGDNPTQAALLLFPMAIMSFLLAAPVGKLTDRIHPRLIMGVGFTLSLIGSVAIWHELTPGAAIWKIAIGQVILGTGNAFIWAPTAATATRNLPMNLAGAGAGVYNATRQVGSVVGSAAIAVLLDARIAHYLPGHSSGSVGGKLPAIAADPFAHAMRDAFLLPTLVYIIGLIAVMFYELPKHAGFGAAEPAPAAGH